VPVLVAVVLSVVSPASAQTEPTTWVVDDDGVQCPGALPTIEAAVIAAADGDTVEVCPGTYTETVTVDESITLKGARAGQDARTRGAGDESILNHPSGSLRLEADDVVVDGFTIREATTAEGGALGAGIYTSPSFAGYTIRNNVLRDNITGLYLNSSGTLSSLVRRNLIRDNNEPGPGRRTGTGIYSDLGLAYALIEENKFVGHNQASVNLSGGRNGSTTSHTEITILDNLLVRDNSISFYNTTFGAVIGNVLRKSQGSGVYIGGGVRSLDILANDFLSGTGFAGVRFAADSSEPEPSSDILVRYNIFSGNANWGVFVREDRYAGILDARRNWWGHSSGPREWGNGFGDAVSAHVSFFPWSTGSSFNGYARCSNRFTGGEDVVRGTAASEILCGGGGDDLIKGGGGRDLLRGGGGDDILKGQRGPDKIIGDLGDDVIKGGGGADWVQGWDGLDVCEGENEATCEL